MRIQEKKELVAKLSKYVTDQRFERINKVVQERTYYITAILEDIYQVHNASAVLRSCDGFGIANVNIIEQKFAFRPCEGVSKGAGKWVNLVRYNEPEENNTARCFEKLRQDGYKIAVTTPHTNDILIQDLPVDNPIALVFGSEQTGVTEYALNNADYFVKIPLYGFVESYNIAVSAAICLYEASKKIRELGVAWQLTEEQQLDLKIEWLSKNSAKAQEELLKSKD